MSDPVTALNGAAFSAGIATIDEVPLQGMITLRGDLSDTALTQAVNVVVSGDLPERGTARIDSDTGVAWMSPDELLILCAYADVASVLESMQQALGKSHALAVNVSDARASFRISGPHAREVLAKLCPVDLSPAAFGPGMFRRTRMAQVPAAMWLCGEDSLQVICFRSQAQYVFDLLSVAAQEGSDIGVF
ncbi:MAG: sarcosine oxidase subunit gamma family protein [Pseudomonadota bacterium]